VDDELQSEVRDGIAKVTINRPDVMNAMHKAMWSRMADLMRGFENNKDVRVIVISGAGGNFCSGGDVKEFSTTLDYDDDQRGRFWMESGDKGNQLFNILERMPQPVLASVRGMAAGGGMAMVAASDLAIASENSRYLAAQINVGVIPDSGLSYNLVRNLGLKRAKQYCLLGEKMDSATALDIGLVNWVVPDAELEARTDAIAKKLASMARVAVARTKAATNVAYRISIADHLYQESLDIGAVVREPDYLQRVNAFMTRARG
jgi:2-(1,2-epoxy-1,2-dihydrophenyl)acetyl-CoA isomerase